MTNGNPGGVSAQQELFPRDYSKGLTEQERNLLHSIIRQWPELKQVSQWCKYHRTEWLMDEARKGRAA